MTVKFSLAPGVRIVKFYLAPGMRNGKIYLAPNDSYKKIYLAVKGLMFGRFLTTKNSVSELIFLLLFINAKEIESTLARV